MTREEIEYALLTTGTVNMDRADGNPIVLNGPRGRRLAEIVFHHLRSSSFSNLSNNHRFFEILEKAFRESDGHIEVTKRASYGPSNRAADEDKRSWRLKKVETRGFGGLNAGGSDIFKFDPGSQDFLR